ncbi:putative sulfate exporter family transporter, partial [Patulibacter sp.]|uniref:putative sulfate exporter family transporter n=1 Tax=Patulibacter sp. TaxID=1912859 RepID=UPI002728B3D7
MDATTAPRSRVTETMTTLRKLAPGLLLSFIIALAAYLAAPWVGRIAPIPAIIIALIIGVALNPVAVRPQFQPGITFAVKKILRWAVALLGLKIALGDIYGIGLPAALIVIVSMVATVLAGLMMARLLGQAAEYGALAGVGTA